MSAVAATGAFSLAGCGTATTQQDADGQSLTGQQSAAVPAGVEISNGRLGDATLVGPGGRLLQLSRGGGLDVRPRHGGTPHDGVAAGAACANPDLAPDAGSIGAVGDATLCLLNGERADRGLAPLALNGTLSTAAVAYAQDLVAGSYFSHTGRDGSTLLTRIQRSGYVRRGAGWTLGENLAWGTGGLATAGSIMRAWMNSPGHRANILNPDFREIGIGVVPGNPAQTDGAGATYDTEFGLIESDQADQSQPASGAAGSKASKATRKRAQRHARARKARRARAARKARAARHLAQVSSQRNGPKAHKSS